MSGALNCSPAHLASYISSLAQAAASWPTSSLGTAPSVPWTSTRTVSTSSSHGKQMAPCPGSLSLATCATSTDPHGQLSWIFSVPDSPVNLFPQPVAVEEPTIPVTSGPMPSGWFARYDRPSSSWRMPQDSLLMASSERFSATWPMQAMMHGGVCSELTILAHRITAKGSGYSPTTAGFAKRHMARHVPTAMQPTMLLAERPVRAESQRTWSTPRESDWRSGKVSL